MKMPAIYKLSKFIIFVIAGILVLIFNEALMNDGGGILNGVVGTVIAVYGVEGIVFPIVTKKIKEEKVQILNGAINVLVAVIMIFLLEGHPHELRVVCIIWSLWSILTEGQEIVEKGFEDLAEHPTVSAINFAESILVIVFSVMLICARSENGLLYHAHAHVILLGIELIIEVLWVYAAELESRMLKRIKSKHRKG